MNLAHGSLRLLLVVFIAWTLFCGVNVAWREWARADRDYVADCRIRQQAIAQFDLQKCLAAPAASPRKREQAIERSKAWFAEGGYLFWLLPPVLITALAVILIAAGAFVYRGFTAE